MKQPMTKSKIISRTLKIIRSWMLDNNWRELFNFTINYQPTKESLVVKVMGHPNPVLAQTLFTCSLKNTQGLNDISYQSHYFLYSSDKKKLYAVSKKCDAFQKKLEIRKEFN